MMTMKSKMKNSIIIFIPIAFFCFSCSSMPIDKNLLSCDVETYNKPLPANEDLFYAVKAGDLKKVKQTLNRSVNINVADRLGQSILMWAGWSGNYEILEYLLNFDVEQRKKSYYPLNYKTESKEKYNPLFCLIMSNKMQTSNTLKAMELLINNEKNLTGTYQLLEKEDSFNENILHKAVRSSYPEYLAFFIEQLKKNDPSKTLLKKLLEKKNTSLETSLVLAVKLQNEAIVKILIDNGADILKRDSSKKSLSVLALDEGRGNYWVYLAVMQAKLKYALDEEKTVKEKQERKYLRTDKELEEAIGTYIKARDGNKDSPFVMTYNRFIAPVVLNPDELEDSAYQDTKKLFFDLIYKADNREVLAKIKEMIMNSPYIMQERIKDEETGNQKGALQISIENGNEDLFTALFECSNRNQIPQISAGNGDYLICAILNKQPRIIKKLLEYNKNSTLPKDIMSPSNYERLGSQSIPPLVYFLRSGLHNDATLLDDILIYYKSQYTYSNYAQAIYEEALLHNDERLIELLYKCSNTKDEFYNVDIMPGGSPVHIVLLERKFFKALQMFLENSKFDKEEYNYKYKDKNNKEYIFQELLDERKNEPEVEKIIEYLKSVKLYKEKTTQ